MKEKTIKSPKFSDNIAGFTNPQNKNSLKYVH